MYLLGTMKKGLSTTEISHQFGIHQETAWFFKQKVIRAMAAMEDPILPGVVEVDETTIGGHEPGKPGRSHGKKTKVQVAVEVQYSEHTVKVKLLKAKGRIIKDYTSASLGRAIEDMLSPAAYTVKPIK